MKPIYFALAALVAGSIGILSINAAPGETQSGYVAHEWGTFTSVQGGNGVMLDWLPLKTSGLPGFVYDWRKAGPNRIFTLAGYGKGEIIARQRMETPVIYFYAKEEQTVGVSVRFPQGLITEWYPQASRVGPCLAPTNSADALHQAPDSRIEWSDVRIMPGPGLPAQPASGDSANHYFAARRTDSALLSVRPYEASTESEREKFLFYRGVGKFATPLVAGMGSDGSFTVSNSSSAELKHLFLLNIHGGRGTFRQMDNLAVGKNLKVWNGGGESLPAAHLADQIGSRLAAALVSEGLYPREAQAMVNTWKDSWFTEEGTRVLYVLPRSWTDQTLPMTLTPAPRELVRVMIGRAEIIAPENERKLHDALAESARNQAAHDEAKALLARMGRFASPAVQLVAQSDPHCAEAGAQILAELAQPAGQPRFQ